MYVRRSSIRRVTSILKGCIMKCGEVKLRKSSIESVTERLCNEALSSMSADRHVLGAFTSPPRVSSSSSSSSCWCCSYNCSTCSCSSSSIFLVYASWETCWEHSLVPHGLVLSWIVSSSSCCCSNGGGGGGGGGGNSSSSSSSSRDGLRRWFDFK